ncbi:hypothetical protein PPS11_28618 [Pseudomonas putida S11]|nr:hypothetical protein PPS11_28618 [Pseudomonas putida S11]
MAPAQLLLTMPSQISGSAEPGCWRTNAADCAARASNGPGTLGFGQVIANHRPALLDGVELLGTVLVEGPGERGDGQQAGQYQTFHLLDSLLCQLL